MESKELVQRLKSGRTIQPIKVDALDRELVIENFKALSYPYNVESIFRFNITTETTGPTLEA
jgi:hypothetical protein